MALDKISLFGLALGIGAIVGGQFLEGGHLSSLVQPTAFVIVIGGTLGAVMLQNPLATFLAGVRMGKWVFDDALHKTSLAVVQPDLAHAGGITECKKIAAMAEACYASDALHARCLKGMARITISASSIACWLDTPVREHGCPRCFKVCRPESQVNWAFSGSREPTITSKAGERRNAIPSPISPVPPTIPILT